MSINNFRRTLEKGAQRFAKQGTRPAKRSDCGQTRVDRRILDELRTALQGQHRPSMKTVLADLQVFCDRRRLACPCRATVYKLMRTLPIHRYPISSLPPAVQTTLYNLDPQGDIPGHQLAFYCFNYGDLPALCFGAGLPWVDLYQAVRMRGFRARSRGLLEAVNRVRGI
jgi:hypothetical protein